MLTNFFWKIANFFLPDLNYIMHFKKYYEENVINSVLEEPVKLYPPCIVHHSNIGKYTYVSQNAIISYTGIGRFCSIGPNLICGWGIHPINGISTSPMFYSTKKQNGFSFCENDKVEERKRITIGNDVFIGMNVIILDGITIGDGAIIGAGTIVSQDVEPYAIVAGNPLRLLRYRFEEETIQKLLGIRWWNFNDDKLKEIESDFFDVAKFLAMHSNTITGFQKTRN